MSKNLLAWVEAALVAACAAILSLIPPVAGWFSPSYGAIILVLFSLRRGLIPGLMAGLLWGLLHFPLGDVTYLSVSQVAIEYLLAFASMGFAGLLSGPFLEAMKVGKNKTVLSYLFLASALGVVARYLWHYIAGVIFWGKYAPAGVSPFWYSFTVNGTAAFLTFLITVVVLSILVVQIPRLFIPKNQ